MRFQLFAAHSARHRLEFEPADDPLTLVGDRDRIGQAVANLLSNAIKYSPRGGVVTVTATTREGFARVIVSDSGLGIPADQRAKVFTKFFRVDTTDTRKIGGTGLGLALCREIATAHGGRIGFDSTEGVGSTFWLELPTTEPAAVTVHGTRVLVIEDEPTLAALLVDCLMLDGMEVETRPTGASGLARALARPPAVICLDIDLPQELDCWQVLVRLKSNPATAQIPVVVCAEANRRGTAAALGASVFLPTPFAAEQLRHAVAQQLTAERSSVLVVGDDRGLRRLVVESLAPDGGDLREAAEGIEAFAMIAASPPDVLVLDLALPGPDGFAAIERLLELPETRGLPVVVLTGRELSAGERRFLDERSASLLEKRKYSADQLRRLVQRAPGASQAVVRLAALAVLDSELPQEEAAVGAGPSVPWFVTSDPSTAEPETRRDVR
jgi:CheY-like chemotaxis protein